MPIPDEGNPTNWTLRFKHGYVTILLYTEPLTPFATLKTELLETLRERYPVGLPVPLADGHALTPETIPIPESIDDVIFGVPLEEFDVAQGWKELELTNGGKGMRNTPKNLGVKDGSMVAFKFRGEEFGDESFAVTLPSLDDEEGGYMGENIGDGDDEDAEDMES